jgi:hypothetical protein
MIASPIRGRATTIEAITTANQGPAALASERNSSGRYC